MPYRHPLAACLLAWLLPIHGLVAQITVTGVSDKGTYPDTATFTIVTQAGFNYTAFLNTNPVPAGVPVTVTRPDYYELRVQRTETGGGTTVNSLIRFIVRASERGGTEWGLPPHTPWPIVQSSAAEFEGGQLRLMTPASFPAGYEIPVVAWVDNGQGHPLRANGLLTAAGQNTIQIRRGHGSGFLSSNTPPGTLTYEPAVGGLTATRQVQVQPATAWTTAGATLGNTAWPANSRIHVTAGLTIPAGVTLTIGAGTIVRLNGGIDITNNGTIQINGTLDEPVVFMPTIKTQPWGGFISKTANAGIINGTGVIFTGSGANASWFGSGGNPGSHRLEQALFYLDGGQQLTLTDAAAIFLAGQLGHTRSSSAFTPITLTRFLMQRTPTGGEFTGARFTVNDSAFIECPDDSANYVDGDNDGLYLVDNRHFFTNTLVGWTKDDGIDSGGSGYGPITYQSCWFEAAFHEGNSLSGFKNTLALDTVYIDCGQGIEDGYDAPTGRVDRCLFTACKSGIRHGDNYDTQSGYDGLMTATNCLSLHNHRDLFGYNWDSSGGWTNNYGRFIARGNRITSIDTNFPDNTLWDPVADAWRLAAFGAKGRVGVALAVRPGQATFARFPDGVPVGLSMLCTNEVRVHYTLNRTDGSQTTGTLPFAPGEIHKFIPLPPDFTGALSVTLLSADNADLTGTQSLLLQNLLPPPGSSPVTLSALGAAWRYLDNGSDQGTAWRAPDFNDSSWSNGVARLGFGPDAAATTLIRRYLSGTSGPQVTNYYFRRAFVVTNTADFTNVLFRYQRDDGCVIHLNGTPIATNNMPAGPITFQTPAASVISGATETQRFWTNILPASVLLPGTNMLAAEVHQGSATSSDIAWECEVQGLPPAPPTRVHISLLDGKVVVYWSDPRFSLEQSPDATNPSWSPAGNTSPVQVDPALAPRIYRLRGP